MLCIRVQGSKLREGGEGGTRQNCKEAPLILSFIAFLCDNFQNFPNFPNFEIPQGAGGVKSRSPMAQGEGYPPSPPFGHICQKVTGVLMDGILDPILKILEVNRTSRWTVIS